MLKEIKSYFSEIKMKKERKNSIFEMLDIKFSEQEKQVYDLLIAAHSIEKRMCILNERSDKKFILKLVSNLMLLLHNGYNPTCYEIAESTSILYHVCKECNFEEEVNKLKTVIDEYSIPSVAVGLKDCSSVQENDALKEFISTRRSIRWFEDKLVPVGIIKEVVSLANTAPSACNRQPNKVYYSTTKEGNDLMRTCVPDRLVSKNIYNFFVVTGNRKLFKNAEVMQIYVNGGIFVNSLLLSLHAYGLGACAFQCPINLNPRLKKVLSIDENEDIICFIGYGYTDTSKQILCATRRNVDEVAREIKYGRK